MMQKLFVLAGKARTGKDSASEIIQRYYCDKKVVIYPCTLYLKNYVKKIYDWGGSEEDKPREILQNLGRDIKEKYPNFFINRMDEDIEFLGKNADILIITGVRLQKELEFLKKKYKGILIKIEKTILDNNLTLKQRNDITETDVDNYKDYDYIINNDGSLNDLKIKVNEILEEVQK